MLKGNCQKKNLTTCERKISSYKPAFRNFAKLTGKHLCQRLFFNKIAGQRCSVENALFEISQNSQENTCARDSFLIKLQVRSVL